MSNQKKNILFLPKWYPNSDNLYHGIFIHRHAVCAVENHNVDVLFAMARNQKSLIEVEESVEDGVNITRYYYKKRIPSILKLLLYFYCILKGWRNRKVDYDILHIHVLGRTSIAGLIINFFNKISVVITEHWSGYFSERNQYKNFWRKYFDRKICRLAKYILTVSDAQSKAMQNHRLKGNYKTIRNVVVNDFFETKVIENKSQFLVVADQDNEVKNIDSIIKAFLKFENKHIKLAIIGGGVDFESNRELVNQLDLNDRVFLYGEQNAEFIKNELSKSYALILFSNFENSPCVIGESFAAGVPVIATKVGGVSEMVDDEKGVLVYPKSETELIEAMKLTVLKSYDSDMLKAYAEKNFSMKDITKQLNDIYQSI